MDDHDSSDDHTGYLLPPPPSWVLTRLSSVRKIRRDPLAPPVSACGLVLTSAALAGRTSTAESLAETACAPGYKPCLPVRADLDCGQMPDAMKPVRVTGADPYGLDTDRDGLGCEVFGVGLAARGRRGG